MKIVSSPDTVPATSAQPALSMAAATLPAERLNVQSQKTDLVALQARQLEEQQRMNAANQNRQQSASQQADKRQAEQGERYCVPGHCSSIIVRSTG